MNIKKIKRIGIGLLSVVFLSGLAWAVEDVRYIGGLAMPMTQVEGTARAMAMGSAVVGLPQGSASLLWNPAGLGVMDDCMEAGLHHNFGLGDSVSETAVFGMPMGIVGGFAAALNYGDKGKFNGYDSAGNGTGNYSAGNMGVRIGWGKEWIPGLSAGVTGKYNRQTLDDQSYNAFMADLGLMWNPISRLNFGLTYSNLGPKVADKNLDSGFRAGISYGLGYLLLAVSSELKPGGFDRVQGGMELNMYHVVALRVGYVNNLSDNKLEDLTGLTAGIGVQIVKNMMLDYAYVPFGELGITHRLSLTYKFGCMDKAQVKPQEKVSILDNLKPAPIVKPVPVEPVAEVIILEKLIVLDDTHFTFDTATLTKEGAKIVVNNAQILRDNPKAKIRIAGYASASGTEEYNQKLSERRAKAVEKILVDEGFIAPERLTTIGYGDTRPAMYEPIPEHINSREAHANMRVLFEIITK